MLALSAGLRKDVAGSAGYGEIGRYFSAESFVCPADQAAVPKANGLPAPAASVSMVSRL